MKSILKFLGFLGIALFFFSTQSCKKDPDKDNSINFFSIEDDLMLGAQVANEIENNPAEFTILDSATYLTAYEHLYRMRDSILNGGKVRFKDQFPWRFRIIQNDTVLNAFAAPGGYIYVYTGLIKFLDAEHELAGVLAHEIAHADRRHSTDQLTRIYGLQVLLAVVIGNDQNALNQIVSGLLALRFSRNNEREADEYSVRYLCPTEYTADGAAAFFEKIGMSGVPEFLSTHPDPGDRVLDIREQSTELACTGSGTFDARYQNFKNSLP